jgi:DsbC/DsbD-like thiol-disulfide interchange protein/cytochrome c biogenesis protein CcdA
LNAVPPARSEVSVIRAVLLFSLLALSRVVIAQTYEGVEVVRPALIANTTTVVPGKTFKVGLHMRLAPGWHTYWQHAGDAGLPPKIEWHLPPGFRVGAVEWPIPHRITEEGDLVTYAYEDELLLAVEVTAPAELGDGEVNIKADAKWLVCEKICIPGSASLTLQLPVAAQASPANEEIFSKFAAQLPDSRPPPFQLAWSRKADQLQLKVEGLQPHQTADFYPLPPANIIVGHPQVQDGTITIPILEGSATKLPGLLVINEGTQRGGWFIGSQDSPSHSLAVFLLFGFAGGFLLNLMPCVLPVIALKIFGFIHQAGQSPARILRLGLAFVAGMFTWFLALGALVVMFKLAGRELNWAFQFQHPGFLVAMLVIILLFALNLLGAFEIILPGKLQTRLTDIAAREGYGGAFLHGVFATLMATPCTAPFLGPALGFAFAQSPAVIFAMFGAIAAGMSFPYLVLSARPGWMRFLPKPGIWMVRVKQGMGVLLLGTAIWLGWVLAQQRVEREPFAPQLAAALATDQIVFIDFTADWCVNCKVNERLVLNTDKVQQAFQQRNVKFLRADWTRGDPDITELLKQFGRAAVPAYVIYPADRSRAPIVLPELLTIAIVVDALQQAETGR